VGTQHHLSPVRALLRVVAQAPEQAIADLLAPIQASTATCAASHSWQMRLAVLERLPDACQPVAAPQLQEPQQLFEWLAATLSSFAQQGAAGRRALMVVQVIAHPNVRPAHGGGWAA
jgi:hypothetical protein